MDPSANLVRRATIFAIASTFLYHIIRNAKMYEVHRVHTSSTNLQLPETTSAMATKREFRRMSLGDSSRQHPLRSIRRSSRISMPKNEDTSAILLESRSNLPNFAKSIKIYYRLVCALHIVLAIKYIVLCVLDMGFLAHIDFGYIDCLLAGRATINPRIVGLCKYACMCVFCFHAIHNSVLINRTAPFRVSCLEFLLMSPETIGEFSNSSHVTCRLLSYKDPPAGTNLGHVRLNRTVHAWRRLATCATLWIGSAVVTYVVLTPFIWFFVLPMIVTRPGFEANYQLCLGWIAQQDVNSSWRRLVYELPANYTGPAERWRDVFTVPLSEPWVEMNAYHIARIVWEVIENFFGQFQVWINYSLLSLISTLISLDIYYYCRQIEAEIVSIIREQRELQQRAVDDEQQTKRRQRLQRIDNAHALVLDLFALIRDYELYTMYYVCFSISVWYTYSFICCSWLFTPHNRHQASTIESRLIQVAATGLVLSTLGLYASARLACRHLYKSIATIVTFQDIDATGRKRWLVILQHYSPVPLYCFSLFNTAELSWMFALKLAAWLFSALLILSSFTSGGTR